MSENSTRSEIFDTGHPEIKAARIEIAASPSIIFGILSGQGGTQHKNRFI